MRKLLWVGLALVAVAIIVLLVAALSLDRIVAGQRDRILAQARSALGREVSADRISVNLWGGLGVRVTAVRVGEDPRFGSGNFLRADTVIVRTNLLPLLEGRIEIGRIDLRQPQVQLIRNQAGQWNYGSLGHIGSGSDSGSGSAPPAAARSDAPTQQLPLVIARANIDDGTLVVIDRSRQPERTVQVTQVNLAVSDLAANTPVTFKLDAAIDAAARNLHLDGTAGPWAPAADTPLRINGAVGPIGPHAVRVDEFHLQGILTPERVGASQLTGRAFGGTFQLSGEYPLGSGAAAIKGGLSNVALARVLQVTSEGTPPPISGTGELRLDLRAAGGSAEAMRATLAGTIGTDLHDVVIKDVNVVNEVLGRLTNLPKIGELVSHRVKPKYARLFADPDTHVRRLHADFQVADQRMHTDDLSVEANDFIVRAAGSVDFDRNIDMTGTLAMSKGFTQDVVADVKEAKYLTDEQGQLAVPFRMRGQLGRARPEPDTAYLLARLSQAIAPGAVKGLVEKFFGGGSRSQQPTPPKGAKPENPLEQRLRDLLGR